MKMNKTSKLAPPKLLDDERKEILSQLIPESVEDGKINVERIKESLGEFAEDESATEHFELTWPGKREAKKVAITASKGTLVPAPGEGVDEDKTKNLFIEGENLEVLKLLHKSYIGQIKMIYIDPPYNTGSDFVYSDKFSDSIEEYRRVTGQVDSEGREMETNKKSDGRFHSRWLSMMYPRLKIAKDFLKNDGVIYVSIDDNEVHNLRTIMNEIFGEENFQGTFAWKKRHGQGKQPKENNLSIEHEYIVAYSKNDNFSFYGVSRNRSSYTNPDNDPRGDWAKHPLDVGSTKEERPNCYYDLIDPDTRNIYKANPNRVWAFYPPSMEKLIKEKKVIFDPLGKNRPGLKKFWDELKSTNKQVSTWIKNVGENDDNLDPEIGYGSIDFNTTATKYLNSLFGKKIFDYPKPTSLISFLINQSNLQNGDLVLDFFAGSGSTADAVFDVNSKDNRKRYFICIQWPELTNEKSDAFKAGYKNIAEISKERIKLSGERFKKKNKADIDYGFKVFKLQKSNYRDQNEMLQQGQINMDFTDLTSPLVKGWKPEDLLTEVILLEGFPLDSKIEQLSTIQTNKVQVVSCDDPNRTYKLFVCLDDKIDPQTISGLTFSDEDKFICLDSAISDTDKLTLSDKAHLKVI